MLVENFVFFLERYVYSMIVWIFYCSLKKGKGENEFYVSRYFKN